VAKCSVCELLPPFAQHIHEYPDLTVETYAGNPLARALGPLLSEEEALQRLAVSAGLPPDVRSLPSHLRIHELGIGLKRLYIPTSQVMALRRAIEHMLYARYQGLNPILPGFNNEVRKRLEEFDPFSETPLAQDPFSSTLLVRGIPGLGKSRGIQRCIAPYSAVIYHTEFQGQPFSFQQRVAVKLDCPPDGSVRGLCLQFLAELDRLFVLRDGRRTKYYERYRKLTKNELLPVMANLALRHGVGLLVIDEIQNLLNALVDGPDVILSFLVSLENTIGIPVLLAGTYAADDVLLARYHQVRRSEGEGSFVWNAMPCDEEWVEFVKALLTCQVLRKPARWSRDLSDTLHALSFGVTDIALRIFRFAQEDAIDEEMEQLTSGALAKAAQRHCPLSRGVMQALEDGDWGNSVLESLHDILPLERRKDLLGPKDKGDDETQTDIALAEGGKSQRAKVKTDKASSEGVSRSKGKTKKNGAGPRSRPRQTLHRKTNSVTSSTSNRRRTSAGKVWSAVC
jgi:hypothetical protein